MAKTKKSPNTRDILKNRTRSAVKAWAKKNDWDTTESGNVVWVGNAKCTFDSDGKLLMVE